MNTVTLGEFDDYFRELHGHEPYDWQRRLARQAVAGNWPDVIDLPTGSGKTACLDVAVFALACQSALRKEDRTAPRRIFFCVNRRVIVDEAYQRAVRIARELWNAERNGGSARPTMQRVASALREISGMGGSDIPPLDVLELRGGIYRDNRWSQSIAQPMIVCTTIDQLGSRILFRGYGVSSGAAPIQAALIAYDSLVLLDEAHISRPFLQTLQWIDRYLDPAKWAEESVGVPRMKVVPMTATPPDGVRPCNAIHLEEADRQNERLNQRLSSSKPAVLKRARNVSEAAVVEAGTMSKGKPTAVGIIVNRVATAREVFARLCAQHPNSVVELVIGSMRPLDRDRQADRLRELVGPGRPPVTEQTSFVVATQCLEVGADYDFDALVTECASLDALRQRFGRLNRGGRKTDAQAVILIDEKQVQEESALDKDKPLDPIYGNALTSTWNWLWEHSVAAVVEEDRKEAGEGQRKEQKRSATATPGEIRSVDFGIDAFNRLLQEHGDDGRIPEELLSPSSKLDAPVMLPAYIDLWCQTSPQPVPDPDVSVFIHGLQKGSQDVQVCWRADLIEDEHNSVQDWPDVVSLLPPTAAECMSVPIGRLRRWLIAQDQDLEVESDLLVTLAEETEPAGRLRTAGVLWKGTTQSTVLTDVHDLYPGCTVVLPAKAKGWDKLGHIPQARVPKDDSNAASEGPPEESLSGAQADVQTAESSIRIDVAEGAFLQAKDRAALRIHPAIQPLIAGYSAAQELLGRISDDETPPTSLEVNSLAEAVVSQYLGEQSRLGAVTWDYYPDRRGLVVTMRSRLHRVRDWYLPSLDDGEDQLSQSPRLAPVSLSAHTEHVVREAEAAMKTLPIGALDAVFRVASRCHDWGKADERFQALLRRTDRSDAWMYAWATSQLLAKSDGMPQTPGESKACRIRAELPLGFRHEMLSVQLAERSSVLPAEPRERALILHLIAAHHGYARPFAPVVIDEHPPDVFHEDVELAGSDRMRNPPHRLDSGIAERFWDLTRRYGWWGLALLEAVLRLADQQASAKENSGTYPEEADEALLMERHPAGGLS